MAEEETLERKKEKENKVEAKEAKQQIEKMKSSKKKVIEEKESTQEKTNKAEKEKSKKKEKESPKKEKEEIRKANNKEALVVQKEIEIDEKKLEKIGEEIKKQTTIPEEKKKKINKKIFTNIMMAIVVVLYFIFLNIGFHNLKPSVFLKDLQVYSMVTIGITIIIFERAYKKDSGELTIYGIETLVLAICTLMTIYIGGSYKEKFTYIINSISMLFAVYYVGKSIVIYHKMTKKALKRASDIHKIRRVKE